MSYILTNHGCKRATNPCKICLEKVTNKTGLQCQGPCQAWVHFKCLDYTPGQIFDVKKKHLIVKCPCPDCKTTAEKEYYKEVPFACTNVRCPANNPPSCDDRQCLANLASINLPPRCPPPGTLRNCGETICKNFCRPASSPPTLKDSSNEPTGEPATNSAKLGQQETIVGHGQINNCLIPVPGDQRSELSEKEEYSPEQVYEIREKVEALVEQLAVLVTQLQSMATNNE